MCTFILAWQVFEDAPVVVAANRDEALGRSSHPPGRYSDDPAVIAPWDEEAGGTWIGTNERGVLVAITNRWIDGDIAERGSASSRTQSDDITERSPAGSQTTSGDLAGERSRGLLVGDALEHDSAEDAARFAERSVREYEYEGFNLVCVDENAALLLEWDGGLRVRNFDPGVHIVVNVGADTDFEIPATRSEIGERQAANTRRAMDDLRPEPGERSEEWRDRAAAVLCDHDYGFCVHEDRYGTRSSSLIRIGGGVEYRFADGPPCETGYERVDASV